MQTCIALFCGRGLKISSRKDGPPISPFRDWAMKSFSGNASRSVFLHKCSFTLWKGIWGFSERKYISTMICFIYFCISECDRTLSTAMIFSQNIAVGSWVHLSAASVVCAYQLQMKIHSIIGQALARFWFLCQQQKPTQHWHEIIHQVLHKDSSLIWCSGLIGFSVMAWLMHQNFCVLLVCHQWWDMLWHLLEKRCC